MREDNFRASSIVRHHGSSMLNRERLTEMMERFEIDLLIATSPENIFYAAGYMPFQGVWNRFPKAAAVGRRGEPVFLTLPMNEIGFAADDLRSSNLDLHFFGRTNFALPATDLDPVETWMQSHATAGATNVVDSIVNGLGDRISGNVRIAIDQTGAPELASRLASRLPTASVEVGGEEVWRVVRMVKTVNEQDRLARAIDVNEAGIAAVHAHLDTDDEIGLARVYNATVGAAGGAVQHWIGSFGRRAGAYRRPSGEKELAGHRFRFDCGIVFDGYCSDLGGTAQVGTQPSTLELSTYRALTAGIERALDVIRPGVPTSSVYTAVIDAVRRSGLADYQHTLVGHGIGIEPRDYPILGAPMHAGSRYLGDVFDPVIEVGMVLNIECPIIQLADGGFQHEVTLVVEESGARLLSQLRDYRVVPTRT